MAEIPRYLEDQTEEQIMQRMLDRLPADLDKSEGSFLWDAEAPVAFMLSEAALWAQELCGAALRVRLRAVIRIFVRKSWICGQESTASRGGLRWRRRVL